MVTAPRAGSPTSFLPVTVIVFSPLTVFSCFLPGKIFFCPSTTVDVGSTVTDVLAATDAGITNNVTSAFGNDQENELRSPKTTVTINIITTTLRRPAILGNVNRTFGSAGMENAGSLNGKENFFVGCFFSSSAGCLG